MADEDEIDILGDFQLDSNLYVGGPLVSQNTELLNCDYTIHPQWLLDRPSTNPDNWYDTNTSTSNEKPQTSEIDMLGHLSTENSITDESGWTEKEKSLLERGIGIFGKSHFRVSQFIGTKTAPEVKYYLKNFYLENHTNKKTFECALDGYVLDDSQIPASIEEVIAAVSTAKPTVVLTSHKARKKNTTSSTDLSDRESSRDRSPLVSRKKKYGSEVGMEKCIKHHRSVLSRRKSTEGIIKSRPKVSFKKKELKQKTLQSNKENKIEKMEITTGHGLAVPICEGEEIIKLTNTSEDSDTDVEIDVEVLDSECVSNKQEEQSKKKLDYEKHQTREITLDQNISIKSEPVNFDDPIDLSKISEPLIQKLTSLDVPKSEMFVEENTVSELEKFIHEEYFSGKSVKTAERYLKIRNHMLQTWLKQKPKYLNKTVSRQGLRNCGDVNCLGKIHYLLEQMGAINFGCEQVEYKRPLLAILKENIATNRKKMEAKVTSTTLNFQRGRIRNKKKFNHDGEGGYTMSHDEQGHVIKHTIINEDPVVKPKSYAKKPSARLIYCRPFKNESVQPYKIKLNLSTLLTMDFHAHSCLTEVMGLVAGYWSPQHQIMVICHYEPCQNMASSSTHCDMCPISQAKAADTIHSKGLDILGWFHSHPTFAPEPSHQDLETQQYLQQWIGQNRPCIGMIMSPFSINGAMIASPFRCMMVDKKIDIEDQLVPYKFEVDVDANDFELNDFVNYLKMVVKSNIGVEEKRRVDFFKPYSQSSNITFLEKYISSVQMHLAKLGTLNKTVCEDIVNGISSIFHQQKKLEF